MEREQAALGVFVTRQKPTNGTRAEAAEAGSYFSAGLGRMVQRLQIVTVEDPQAAQVWPRALVFDEMARRQLGR